MKLINYSGEFVPLSVYQNKAQQNFYYSKKLITHVNILKNAIPSIFKEKFPRKKYYLLLKLSQGVPWKRYKKGALKILKNSPENTSVRALKMYSA